MLPILGWGVKVNIGLQASYKGHFGKSKEWTAIGQFYQLHGSEFTHFFLAVSGHCKYQYTNISLQNVYLPLRNKGFNWLLIKVKRGGGKNIFK